MWAEHKATHFTTQQHFVKAPQSRAESWAEDNFYKSFLLKDWRATQWFKGGHRQFSYNQLTPPNQN